MMALKICFLLLTITCASTATKEKQINRSDNYQRSGAYSPEPYEARDYKFSYSVKDEPTYNHQTREENKYGDTVTGHYSVLEPTGNLRVVKYIADDYGFRADVQNQGGYGPGYNVRPSHRSADAPPHPGPHHLPSSRAQTYAHKPKMEALPQLPPPPVLKQMGPSRHPHPQLYNRPPSPKQARRTAKKQSHKRPQRPQMNHRPPGILPLPLYNRPERLNKQMSRPIYSRPPPQFSPSKHSYANTGFIMH